MKWGIVIKDKTPILIVMIIFVSLICLIPACSISPKKVWYKSDSTQGEFTRDKYRCELQARQGESSAEKIHATGTFCLDFQCEDSEDQNIMVTNWNVFKTCMEEHGWSYVEKKKK
jgi:hypothetical protein